MYCNDFFCKLGYENTRILTTASSLWSYVTVCAVRFAHLRTNRAIDASRLKPMFPMSQDSCHTLFKGDDNDGLLGKAEDASSSEGAATFKQASAWSQQGYRNNCPDDLQVDEATEKW